MASPAVVAHQVNGLAATSRPDSPASINSSTKRKREDSDDGDIHLNSDKPTNQPVDGLRTSPDGKLLIRDFFDVLASRNTALPEILKRPLPESLPDGEPSPKRAKSEETSRPTTITDKVMEDAYETLHDLVSDVVRVANAQVKEHENAGFSSDGIIARIIAFKTEVLELYRRESAYPNVPRAMPVKAVPGPPVLTAFGAAPTLKSLFTSLQRTVTPGRTPKSLPEHSLPSGVTLTKLLPEDPVSGEKGSRPLTLGELFPSPRNLPPLQPPKAPKSTTKSNVLTFYHPELAEKSKYRSGTYFSQTISAGHWLDYSNATPTTHAKTKQRERAQSLAGHKPSTLELEMSEMEALFRGAFSSFAPCKDDSGAIVPSDQVSRIWWQRVGRRTYAKMVESEAAPENEDEDAAADSALAMEIDEDGVKDAIENWDETAIDPSLDHVLGKKSDHEKDVDDLLEEVSDLIETLASYQRNRNLTLPTSQDRYSTDPVNGDMLRNGNLSHQPTEEEMMTYQALKAQLSLIIQTLPPYAVARLNSDKLAELAVSTKIEVRSDEYRGVMEEDEPTRLARLAAQAATSNQRQAHRTPNVSASPYANHQYQMQFTPSARPVGNGQHFPQTPVRPQPPNMYPRAPSTVPIPQPHHQVQGRAPPPTQFRPQMYAPQLAKAQGPYGHSNMPQQYGATPTQPRMPQHPNYNANHRYAQGYPAGYQQPQQIHPQHPQQGQASPRPPVAQLQAQHSQHAAHPAYANGGQMPRTMSPQVAQAPPYNQSPTPPQQHQQIARAPYGSPGPGLPPNAAPRQYGPGSPGPGMMPGGNRTPSNLTGFATVMPEVQQRQVMEQARARADAEQRASGHMGKVTQGEVVGLAGIGLGGHMDVHKVAAAKMQMGNHHSMSPSPKVPMQHGGPSPVNGVAPSQPPSKVAVSPIPAPPSNTASPAPAGQGLIKPAV